MPFIRLLGKTLLMIMALFLLYKRLLFSYSCHKHWCSPIRSLLIYVWPCVGEAAFHKERRKLITRRWPRPLGPPAVCNARVISAFLSWCLFAQPCVLCVYLMLLGLPDPL